MSQVLPLVDERGQDAWTSFEVARSQMRAERRSGSVCLQVHYKHGQETKTMVTLEQVGYLPDGERG